MRRLERTLFTDGYRKLTVSSTAGGVSGISISDSVECEDTVGAADLCGSGSDSSILRVRRAQEVLQLCRRCPGRS